VPYISGTYSTTSAPSRFRLKYAFFDMSGSKLQKIRFAPIACIRCR